MSLVERYHNFLDNNNIYNYVCLRYYLLINKFDVKEQNNCILINITESTDLDENVICRIFNGLIISKSNILKILCYSGDYQTQILLKELKKSFSFKLDNIRFHQLHNGIFVRLYYYLNKWILSTKEELNIDNSNIIFDLFNEYCSNINYNYTKLSKNYIYTFLFNNESCLLYHLNSYKTLTFEEVDIDIHICKNMEVKIKNMNNLSEICNYTNINQNIIGFIINDIKTNKKYKVYTENFLYLSYLDCDEPDIIKRYIKLKKKNLVGDYIIYYTEYKSLFELLNDKFEALINYFYKSYIDIKIFKKEKSPSNFDLYETDIIYKIHGIYLSLRINTSKTSVRQVLLNYNIDRLVYLLMKD
jgi:hypothetical protein